MVWDIFLAHSIIDTDLATSLYDCLCKIYRVFYTKNITNEKNLELDILYAQSISRITIVLITPNTEEGFYQRKDIETILIASSEKRTNYRLILIFFDTDSNNKFKIFYILPPDTDVAILSANNSSEVAQKLTSVIEHLKQTMTLANSKEIKQFFLLKRADAHILAAHHEQAIRDIEEVLKLNPQNTIALSIGMTGFNRTNQRKKAISCAELILQIETDNTSPSSLSLRAIAYIMLLQDDQAIVEATNALSYDPENTLALLARANANLGKQQYTSAIKDTRQILEIEKWNTRALSVQAASYLGMKHYKEAIFYANKALEIAPKFWWVLETRAYAYVKLRQFDEAFTDLDNILLIAPWCVHVVRYKAAVYLDNNTYNKAISTLQTYMDLETQDPEGWYMMAEASRKLGYFNDAEYFIKKALSIKQKEEYQQMLNKILLKDKK